MCLGLFGGVLVGGGGGCWLAFGAVLAAGHGAAGVASVRSFTKSFPGSSSASPLAKSEPIVASAINILKR